MIKSFNLTILDNILIIAYVLLQAITIYLYMAIKYVKYLNKNSIHIEYKYVLKSRHYSYFPEVFKYI